MLWDIIIFTIILYWFFKILAKWVNYVAEAPDFHFFEQKYEVFVTEESYEGGSKKLKYLGKIIQNYYNEEHEYINKQGELIYVRSFFSSLDAEKYITQWEKRYGLVAERVQA